ncbi:UNKNOWN [Stylonychia lemnae]|uniref:Uncharacterized protein n=1 Tax=Stylonychia lemnae TaxID=5949 RepID=A0A078B675_STYLE|nr:UNKNOWN [Stylonychia lemnae]|eukprot:CDW89874.1 UNKNOWN [Stylonychia lemnae]
MSRPDSILFLNNKKRNAPKYPQLKIVCDAKYYKTQLSQTVIDKSLDDMELRKAYGLIICSDTTKISKSFFFNNQKHKDNLSILKLKPSEKPDDDLLQKLVFPSEIKKIMPEYLNQHNIKAIQQQLEKILQNYRMQIKEYNNREIFGKGLDDMNLKYSQETNLSKTFQEECKGPSKSYQSRFEQEQLESGKNMGRSSSLIDLCDAINKIYLQDDDSKVDQINQQNLNQINPEVVEMSQEQLQYQQKLSQKITQSQAISDNLNTQAISKLELIAQQIEGKSIDQMRQIFNNHQIQLTKDGKLDRRRKENKLLGEYLNTKGIFEFSSLPGQSQQSISQQSYAMQSQFSTQQERNSQQIGGLSFSQPQKQVTMSTCNTQLSQTSSMTEKGNSRTIFFKGQQIPATTSGKPDMRHKLCKQLRDTDNDFKQLLN